MALAASTTSIGYTSSSFSSPKNRGWHVSRRSVSCSASCLSHSSLSLRSSILGTSLQNLRLKPFTRQSPVVRVSGLGVQMSLEAGVGVMGTKLGMMSFFQEDGNVIPVTVIGFREGNIVTQVKTKSTDGYNSVQVGYRRVRDRKLKKPELGHLEKSGVIPLRHLQEFRLASVEEFSPNQKLQFSELFQEGDLVDIKGVTIGKGFQGVTLPSVLFFLAILLFEI